MKKSAFFPLLALVICWTSLSQVPYAYALKEGNYTYTTDGQHATITDFPRGAAVDIIIPNKLGGLPVTAIGETAFYITDITSVVFPNSLTSIGNDAFGYNFLTSVDFPENLTSIGERAFQKNMLTTLVLPDSVTSLGQEVFKDNLLTSVNLSNNLTMISDFAFRNNLLTSVVIPDSVTSIGGYAFRYNNLSSVSLLSRSTVIDPLAFNNNQAIPADLKIFGFSGSVVQSFALSKGFTFVDSTALFDAMTTSKQLLKNHLPGTDIGQVSSEYYHDLMDALDNAELFVDLITFATTVSDLNGAAADLNAMIQAFSNEIVTADVTALEARIAEANQVLTDHPEGTEVGETSGAARAILQAAISAGQGIADDSANQTQNQLDTAAASLSAAVEVFEGAIIQAGDAAALEARIAEANQALMDHPEGTEVGETSGAARAILQAAILAGQGIADDSANQTQNQLDTAAAALYASLEQFEASWIELVLIVPAEDLYGNSGVLRFTLKYAYDVIVTGTPRVPLIIGTGDASEIVYALYSGVRGVPMNELSFSYEVSEGLADEDGIDIAPRLDLPTGSNIAMLNGDTASLAYTAVDTSGIRIVSISPILTLVAGENGGLGKDVTVTENIFGIAVGNTLTNLAWMKESHGINDFVDGAGTAILAAKKFSVTSNGVYTVYAKDLAGNESVKEIAITDIGPSSPGSVSGNQGTVAPDTATIMLGGIRTEVSVTTELTADGQLVNVLHLTTEQLTKSLSSGQTNVFIVVDGLGPAVKVSMPTEFLQSVRYEQPDAGVQVTVNGNRLWIPFRVIGNMPKEGNLATTIIQVSDAANLSLQETIKKQGAVPLLEQPILISLDIDGQAVSDWRGIYVQRKSDQLAAVDSDKATVVWIDAKNKMHFVPSSFASDGTVTIHVVQGGVYTVIQSDRTFLDLREHWAQKDIELLANKLIIDGLPDGRFYPENTITRAEFAALLVRALGLSEASAGEPFTDVTAANWYAGSVGTAQRAGLITGYEDGSFRPNASITREQMAVMIIRAISFAGKMIPTENTDTLLSFADGAEISNWATDATEQLVGIEIIQGMTGTTFAPKASASRAQSAVMLRRMLLYLQYINP
ncbi:hypothetical protein BK133_28885 [Paenibacillus sp. FSL H8-0548]|uniref:leucine-rich repeat protein n=1 Tax=Paenibacillus sp. FSL H8-0548 TaxID=1920422 RepID=UPI00096CAA1D|nr:leucine-rich repeat protein [Paenibacillus sp. FSL H8-0548]OMF21093.1 hypothetical protein BK133_28885 [Paenibacillus sp. FSL H8-0548]